MSERFPARVIFTKPYMASSVIGNAGNEVLDFDPPKEVYDPATDGELPDRVPGAANEDHPILFDPGDAVYAEVTDKGECWDVQVLDQETPLEYYTIPKDVVEVKRAKYSLGRVEFVQKFIQPTAIGDVEVPPGQVFDQAGIVDDGGDKLDLLLDYGHRPIDRLKRVPRSSVVITNERPET